MSSSSLTFGSLYKYGPYSQIVQTEQAQSVGLKKKSIKLLAAQDYISTYDLIDKDSLKREKMNPNRDTESPYLDWSLQFFSGGQFYGATDTSAYHIARRFFALAAEKDLPIHIGVCEDRKVTLGAEVTDKFYSGQSALEKFDKIAAEGPPLRLNAYSFNPKDAKMTNRLHSKAGEDYLKEENSEAVSLGIFG